MDDWTTMAWALAPIPLAIALFISLFLLSRQEDARQALEDRRARIVAGEHQPSVHR